jgi:hypothetical protein
MNPVTIDRSNMIGGVMAPEIDIGSKETRRATPMAAAEAGRNEGNKGKGVDLPQPKPGINQKVSVEQLQELKTLQQSVTQGSTAAQRLLGSVDKFVKTTVNLAVVLFSSPEDFEIELGKLTTDLEKTQKKLKLADIERTRQQNVKKIDENQAQMKEAEEAAEKAKKSGLVGKIFGWISAIASIVIGAIMVATGVGAAAGALMIAGGDGLISKEVMEKLGPVLVGIEIAMAILSSIVTFGGAALAHVAKGAGKIAAKAAQLAAKVGMDTAQQTLSTTMKAVKLGTQAVDVVLDVSNGVAKTVDSTNQSKLQDKQADLIENRQEMTALEQMLEKLREALSQMTEAFQNILEMIFNMVTAKGAMLNNLSSRPAAI